MPDSKQAQVVMRLFDALGEGDRDRIRSFFSARSVLHPAARGPLVGSAAICARLEALAETRPRLVAALACADGRVRAECIERRWEGGAWREQPRVRLLAVEGCKISQWWEPEEPAGPA